MKCGSRDSAYTQALGIKEYAELFFKGQTRIELVSLEPHTGVGVGAGDFRCPVPALLPFSRQLNMQGRYSYVTEVEIEGQSQEVTPQGRMQLCSGIL